ncbi:MAG: sigma-70 family RNA polymerase sigma factor [bacterium]
MSADAPLESPDPSVSASLGESSIVLLHLAREGDREALERLYARYLPRLRRWAHGRIPRDIRGLLDTDDILQDVLLRSVRHIEHFEPRPGAGFFGYLRRGLKNRLRDEYRRVARMPGRDEIDDAVADAGPSPLENLLGRDREARYEAALARLRDEEREAVVARLELGASYAEIAEMLGKPSPDAARMWTGRAIAKLAEELRDE